MNKDKLRQQSADVAKEVSGIGVLGDINPKKPEKTVTIADLARAKLKKPTFKNPAQAQQNVLNFQSADQIPDGWIGANWLGLKAGDYSLNMEPSASVGLDPKNYSLSAPKPTAIGEMPNGGFDDGSTETNYAAQMQSPDYLARKQTEGTAAASPKLSGKEIAIGAAQAGMDAIGSMAQAKKNLSVDEYLMDLNYWKDQGKTWFDKNAEIIPSFEEYMADMPSAEEALQSGSITGSSIADSAIGMTAQGALTGASLGGPVGAGVGAGAGLIVGLIDGVFTWNSAKEKDAKEKERAFNAYKQKLKAWTFTKNQRNTEEETAKEMAVKKTNTSLRAIGVQTKKNYKDEKEQKQVINRDRLIKTLQSVGSFKAQKAQERMARWG